MTKYENTIDLNFGGCHVTRARDVTCYDVTSFVTLHGHWGGGEATALID